MILSASGDREYNRLASERDVERGLENMICPNTETSSRKTIEVEWKTVVRTSLVQQYTYNLHLSFGQPDNIIS